MAQNSYLALKQAALVAERFLDGLSERRVFPDEAALKRLAEFDPPLPENGLPDDTILNTLEHIAEDGVVASAGPRFFGYVTGGALPVSVAASWLAAAWDQNGFEHRSSPLAVRLEEISGRWLLDILRLPISSSVNYVTGSAMANFVGLAAARETIFRNMQWDVQSRGLGGAPPVRIIVGDEAHATALKALGMLGLGRDTAIRVPTDSQGRMRADALPVLGPDCILCLQIGNVNSGAVDPLADIIPRAKAAGAWVHIDGAFGLVAAASPKYSQLLEGHDLADSWAVDGHKWINTPYDCGVAICRSPNTVRDAFSYSAAYLDDGAGARNMVPELSRRARSVEMFAALSSLGRNGLRDLVDRCCAYAQLFANGLRALGYEVLNDVVLNQCVVTIGTPEQVQAIFEHVQRSGVAWVSTTKWQNRFAIRISVVSWATTIEDVHRTLAAIADATSAILEFRRL